MRKSHDMKLCLCCSLRCHLDFELLNGNSVELLNGNSVHHAGKAKGSTVDCTPSAYRELALIPHLAEEKQRLFRLLFYRQVKWWPPRYTLGVCVFSNRLPGLRDMPIGR